MKIYIGIAYGRKPSRPSRLPVTKCRDITIEVEMVKPDHSETDRLQNLTM